MEERGFPFMTTYVLAATHKNFNRPLGQNKMQVMCKGCALESAKACM